MRLNGAREIRKDKSSEGEAGPMEALQSNGYLLPLGWKTAVHIKNRISWHATRKSAMKGMCPIAPRTHYTGKKPQQRDFDT